MYLILDIAKGKKDKPTDENTWGIYKKSQKAIIWRVSITELMTGKDPYPHTKENDNNVSNVYVLLNV